MIALGLVLSLPGSARADSRGALDETMGRYFASEEAQGYAWIAAGDASLVAGGALIAQSNGVLRGMSYPLLAVGAIQFIAGLSSLTRTQGRLAALRGDLATGPAAVRDMEAKRIGGINRLFKLIFYTELSLLGLGAAGAGLGYGIHQDQLLGAGIGVVVEAALMLVLDHFAERRAHRYADGLGAIPFTALPGAEGSALVVGFARRF
ncbi:MAG: hypothetical protein EXR72_27360 [Myxococcales bacterium]|nr:hypothetical protein [Myxococcales bacterium]